MVYIEYFINSIDPSFIIKPYFHGNPVNAVISVYVNLPNSIKFFEEYYGSSLVIPFSSLANYVKSWNRFKNVNTSLLVFVTYKMNNKTPRCSTNWDPITLCSLIIHLNSRRLHYDSSGGVFNGSYALYFPP